MRSGALVAIAGLLAVATAAATPLACADECEVGSTIAAYAPPVLEIARGASVTWTSDDITHVTLDGFFGTEGSCLSVVAQPHDLTPQVTVFDLQGGMLAASEDGQPFVACATAVPLPDGTHILPFFCALHPTMRGALIVSE